MFIRINESFFISNKTEVICVSLERKYEARNRHLCWTNDICGYPFLFRFTKKKEKKTNDVRILFIYRLNCCLIIYNKTKRQQRNSMQKSRRKFKSQLENAENKQNQSTTSKNTIMEWASYYGLKAIQQCNRWHPSNHKSSCINRFYVYRDYKHVWTFNFHFHESMKMRAENKAIKMKRLRETIFAFETNPQKRRRTNHNFNVNDKNKCNANKISNKTNSVQTNTDNNNWLIFTKTIMGGEKKYNKKMAAKNCNNNQTQEYKCTSGICRFSLMNERIFLIKMT